MTAVTYSDGTEVDQTLTGETVIKTWVSPATMDSADTVTVPTVTGKSVYILACQDNTTGDAVSATVSTATVTIDAAGGTTNHVYVLTFMYK